MKFRFLNANKLKMLLALGLSVIAPQLTALPVNFLDGDLTGTFNTNLSFGTGMRVRKIELNMLNPNNNDGDLNYNMGDLYATAFKGVWELDLNYAKKCDLFVRVDSIFDPLILYSHPRRTKYSGTAKHILGRQMRLLDCNVSKGFNFNDYVFSFRIGSQAMNWGENLFISNGLNSINPVDVSKLRSPGNLIKTAILPIWSARMDVRFSDTISGFAWWQWHWRELQIDPKGTYFSTSDVVSPGGFFIAISPDDIDPPVSIRRAHTNKGSNTRNFGATLKYIAKELHDTEFAVYGALYASRALTVSFTKGPGSPLTNKYYTDYPDDIKLVGASFATSVSRELALQGEYSLHIDQPIGISSALQNAELALAPVGSKVKGYRRKNYSQLQVNGLYDTGRILGADASTFLFEAGICWIHAWQHNLDSTIINGKKYHRDPLSAGYTLLFNATYNNAFWSMDVIPALGFTHGVFGMTPAPLFTFTENQLSFSPGVTFDYQRQLQVNFQFTANCGGSIRNTLRDRHFLTGSLTYSF